MKRVYTVGQRVELVDGNYEAASMNPSQCSEYACIGTIREVFPYDEYIHDEDDWAYDVLWDNGCPNTYREGELVPPRVTEAVGQESPKLDDTGWDAIPQGVPPVPKIGELTEPLVWGEKYWLDDQYVVCARVDEGYEDALFFNQHGTVRNVAFKDVYYKEQYVLPKIGDLIRITESGNIEIGDRLVKREVFPAVVARVTQVHETGVLFPAIHAIDQVTEAERYFVEPTYTKI